MLTSTRALRSATTNSLWWKIQTALENHDFPGAVCTQPTTSRREGLVVFLLTRRPIKRNGSEILKSLTEKTLDERLTMTEHQKKKVSDLLKSYTISIWKVFRADKTQGGQCSSHMAALWLWQLVWIGKPSFNKSNNRMWYYCYCCFIALEQVRAVGLLGRRFCLCRAHTVFHFIYILSPPSTLLIFLYGFYVPS